MKNEKSLESEISGFFATLLRQNFGKGPTSVYVTLTRPFLAVHFRGFIAPLERILLDKDENKRIVETRDLLMDDLATDIRLNLNKLTGLDIDTVYAD
ncbi:DUF2294 domain-containing protein [Planococcus sp. MERTA32b]|nr:DUF2294 domain-containing protein [Planococcus sp. MER TA 32b]